MAALSDYLEDELLDHVLDVGSYTAPSAVYVALYTSDPGDDNSGSEVTGGSYARVQATFDAASNGATANTGELTFPTATGDWGTITHFGIFDASSSGNLLIHGALAAPQEIDTGNVAKFPAGSIDITLD